MVNCVRKRTRIQYVKICEYRGTTKILHVVMRWLLLALEGNTTTQPSPILCASCKLKNERNAAYSLFRHVKRLFA